MVYWRCSPMPSPVDNQFHLASAENWNVDSLLMGWTTIDLESVVGHESGQLVGLGHSSNAEVIMHLTITFGLRKVQLVADDMEWVQQLYGPIFNTTTMWLSVWRTMSRERDNSGGEVRQGWQWGNVVLSVVVVVVAVVFGLQRLEELVLEGGRWVG